VGAVSTVELELVPVATTVPSVAVLYRAEHVAMVRRLSLMGAPVELAEHIAHRAFTRVCRHWDGIVDPLATVRQVAIEDVLARFRPPGQAPTRTPPREGAPPAWAAVGPILDPLTPARRVVTVLRVFDGLDDESIARLLPIGRERQPEPVDHRTAMLFADAVADIRPASRLTELLGTSSTSDDAPALPRLHRVRSPRSRPAWTRRGSAGPWVLAGIAAVVAFGLFGGSLDSGLPGRSRPGQELRTGLTVDGAVVDPRSGHSSCPSADPVAGPGGTKLPLATDTDPVRVADVVATDRRALIALHRGATDVRVIPRNGQVLRTVGPGLGRLQVVDSGGDDQIEVVIGSKRDCPPAPEAWKGVPIVFTTLSDASLQPESVLTGRFPDGTEWRISDRPGLGLCGHLGDVSARCGARLDQAAQLEKIRLLADRAGHRVAFGYLPPQAATARLEGKGGELGHPRLLPDGATFFALAVPPDERPTLIRFYNGSGAALLALPFPSP
jgi:hypothetical protein